MGLDRLAAVPLPQPHQPVPVSRAKATAILDQPQFRAARPGWWTDVVRWLGQHLGSGASTLIGGGPGAVLGWLVLALLVGMVVALVAYGTRTLRRDPERADPPLRVEVRRSSADWRRDAAGCEERGDWKEGLRCRYRALVVDLIASDVVLDLPGRTTGEYRGDVGATLPEAAAEFAGASELFERAWYGDRPTGPDEAHHFAVLAESVVERARRRRGVRSTADSAAAPAGDPPRQLVDR